jgi:hypothetical protein
MDVVFGGMPRIGHGATRLLAAALWPALGALAALAAARRMWGFTVDDALISVRYARHLAQGVGWRFDPRGPTSDGVTPLPWPLLLAPMAKAAPLVVLDRARAFGLVVWLATGAWLGWAMGRVSAAPSWARTAALATLALSVPAGAYAVSGMETPLATGLATGAVLLVRRTWLSCVLAGMTASFRPEMAPWACALAVSAAVLNRESVGRAVLAGAIGLVPFGVSVLVRMLVWGRPGPLALLAKPGDAGLGLSYAAAASVVTLVPVLVLAPMALRRTPDAVAVVLPGLVHLCAVVVVGGDWMPFARLCVPVLPGLAWAGVLLSSRAHALATAARSLAALGLGIALSVRSAAVIESGRQVMEDRRALVTAARPLLAGASRVAALDIGWTGAATDADIVDLAGLTDLEIAALPGGHTSKRIDGRFLLSRDPDVALLYAPNGLTAAGLADWTNARYPRIVEARLVRDEVFASHFTPEAWLPLGTRGAGYVVLRAAR